MRIKTSWLPSAAVCGWLLCSFVPAHAGVLDFLFGKSTTDSAAAPLDPATRSWKLSEFTTIQLVPREPGGAVNEHPAAWPVELLRQRLSQVRTDFRGDDQLLFAADEIGSLALPLSQALSVAKPEDDVLLLSTHRREQGFVMAPFGVTARLFVQGGNLQLIVHDSRRDFMDAYIGTKVAPTFTFGSRTKPGPAVIRSEAAISRRSDWLSIPAVAAAGATPDSAGRPTATAVPATAGPAVAPAVPVRSTGQDTAAAAATSKVAPVGAPPMAGAAPTPAPPSAPRSRDPGFADEIEFRLQTLKRLRDKGLISEAEYLQMRKDVLQLL